ncbi:MAG: HlyD family efflux transporter periplasmic adaptor subunit [Pirellulales bacterium]|nr:HlyD family efflux transporter periplasmic adaptor subunit [Pirellulales bacterium]
MKVPMIVFGVLLAAGIPLVVGAQNSTSPAGTVSVESCLVSLIEEVQMPAEEAGVLRDIYVREGDQVFAEDSTQQKEATLLAQIDDTRALRQQEVAVAKQKVAVAKANNTTNIEYSEAASLVAAAEYRQGEDANERHLGTVTPAEMRRLLLTYHKTQFEIKQAKMDKEIAGFEAEVSVAEVKAADEGLQRRKIKTPINGVVVELYRHKGEWVQPGDPVMHIVRLDRLRVEGFVNMRQVARGELKGRPVTVTVQLERGREEKFTGSIVFANPMVQGEGEYQVWAEVENRRTASGDWLLGPGLLAEMTIDLRAAK